MAPRSGFFTLRKRIVLLFTLAALVPFLLIVAVSYTTISSIQTNQIRSRIGSNLDEVKLNIENALENLNHVSQQLALQGSVGSLLYQFLTSDDGFVRASTRDQIRTEMTLISYTNPNVGLMMYTFGGLRSDFESSTNITYPPPRPVPLLVRRNQISYFGPHKSLDGNNGHNVLSVVRKVDALGMEGVAVYLETAFKLTDRILDTAAQEAAARYLFLDADRSVVYSEEPEAFPEGGRVPPTRADGSAQGYLWTEVTSRQGWTLVSVVAERDFNREKDSWTGWVLALAVLFLAVAATLGTLLWRTVYRPLGVFEKEMVWIENLDRDTPVVPVKIPEFDRLLVRFQEMKVKVLRLLDGARSEERLRADLEIETLLHQINPHFLLNALNTVHWLAVVHHQPEIDRFTLSLTKLLSYNLGKRGRLGTVRDEIDALQEYVAIQQLRFELRFEVSLLVDEARLETLLPRFTLQPLVENAIQHGLGDDGWIGLEVAAAGSGLRLTVADHGPGMPPEGPPPGLGMGIGLAYVRKILDFQFAGQARLDIESSPGTGTKITVLIPSEGRP